MIYTFDKIKNKELDVLGKYYSKLVTKYSEIELVTLRDKSEEKISFDKVSNVWDNGFNVVLSETGKVFNTKNFGNYIEKTKLNHSTICFYVGNAYGFKKEVLEKASLTLSLSPMTFPHEMAYVMLVEQLYRVMNLSAGGKYHK